MTGPEREVRIFIHGKFYRKVLRKSKYDYVTIQAQTSKSFFPAMIKEFCAGIVRCWGETFRADFTSDELEWDEGKLVYKPKKR